MYGKGKSRRKQAQTPEFDLDWKPHTFPDELELVYFGGSNSDYCIESQIVWKGYLQRVGLNLTITRGWL